MKEIYHTYLYNYYINKLKIELVLKNIKQYYYNIRITKK